MYIQSAGYSTRCNNKHFATSRTVHSCTTLIPQARSLMWWKSKQL